MVGKQSWFVTAVVGSSLMLVGCLFSPDKKDPCKDCDDQGPRYFDPTSPSNVLKNLETAYQFRDIEGYTNVLADNYVFIPSPFDETVDYDQLNRDQDLGSTGRMFDNVDDVTMSLTYNPTPMPSDLEDYPPEDGYVMVVISAVNISVLSRNIDPGSNEPITYKVPGDPAKVIFKKDTAHSPPWYSISYLADQSGFGRLMAKKI